MHQRRRLVVHIGQHKTGSTYLQKRFVDDRERLKGAGILYPEEFVEIFGHHRIAEMFRWKIDSEGARTLAETLDRLGQTYPTIVLSTENLCFLGPDRVEALRAAFAGWDVKIVYHLRRLTGFLPSHWQELIKHGSDITFDHYMLETLKLERDENQFPDQAKQLHRFTEVFGAENVAIFCYDNILARGDDVYDSFLRHILNVRTGETVGRSSVNTSFGPTRVELIRSLNMLYHQMHNAPAGLGVRQRYMRFHKEIEASEGFARFSEAFDRESSICRLDPTDEAIGAREGELLSKFGDQIINKAAADCIFLPSKPVEVRYATRHWFHAAGQTEFISSILRDVGQPPPQ